MLPTEVIGNQPQGEAPMHPTKTALLSAYTKDARLVGFARALADANWRILASAGTHTFLIEHNIPSTDIANIGGGPILDHRVVTLHWQIHAAILADLDNQGHCAELARYGIEPINLVYVGLGPLPSESEIESLSADALIKAIDIGGPTLLRAAAKGDRYTVSSPHQFAQVLDALRSPTQAAQLRRALATVAELTVAEYAAISASVYAELLRRQ